MKNHPLRQLLQLISQLWRLLFSLLRRGRYERKMEEEMRFHGAGGFYSVIAYSVTQRRREIGVRMALGAGKGAVIKMVIGQGIKLALIGMAIGLAGALGLTRFLSGLLYGVKPSDPLTLVAVSALLIAVAFLACYIPARQAAKVDPLAALRHD